MIAQLFLTFLSFAILAYAWLQYRRSPLVALLTLVTALAGIYLVWLPAHATRLAEFAGIGRGVDLILYTWVGISFIVLLNLHLKIRAQMELITELARELTLLRAEQAGDEGRSA